jgi:TonB-dependent receptor
MVKQISIPFITLFLLVAGTFPVFSQEKIPVFSAESLQNRLERIIKEGGISVSYTAEAVQSVQAPALKPQNSQPEEWLRESLRNTGLTCAVVGDRMYAVIRQAKTATATTTVPTQQGKGVIAGTVFDEDGEPVIGATVVVLGQLPSIGTATDAEGKFNLNKVPAKTVTVQFSLMSYQTLVVEDVKVAAGKTTPLNITLKESAQQLGEVVVTAKYNQASAAGMYAIQKLNASMTDGISSDLIKKTGDNNIAQVLKRVAGVTVNDGKFVTIRGISEKYNNVQLNGSSLPSTEPNRRNFSFDIVPSNLIENVTINKTFTPDLPGEFIGGLVQIKTLSIPDEKSVSLSVGSGLNTIATGNEFQTNQRFKSDYFSGETNSRTWFLGREDEGSKQSIINAGNMNHYSFYSYTAAPLQNYALSLGLPLQINEQHKAGIVAAATYRHEESLEDIKEINTFKRDTMVENMGWHFNKSYKFVTSVGAITNLGWETRNHAVTWRNLFNNRFTHTTLNRIMFSSYTFQQPQLELYTSPLQARLLQTQLDGEHSFFRRRLKLTWNADYNKTSRTTPDDRYAVANMFSSTTFPSPDDSYIFLWGPSFGPSNPFLSTQFIMHSRLDEIKKNAGANAEYSFLLLDNEQKLKAGALHSSRDANYEQAYLKAFKQIHSGLDVTSLKGLFDPANFESGDLYYKTSGYDNRLVDYYYGDQTINAYYLMGEITPVAPLKIVGGVRIEDAETIVETVADSFDEKGALRIYNDTITRSEKKWLPSITAIYSITPALNFRAAYSENLVRADFRELTRVSYWDVQNRLEVKNSRPLEETNVKNYDLRLEWYPASGEVVSLSAFLKDFDKPVEKVVRMASDQQNFSLLTVNLDRFIMRGLELNFRKSLHFISRALDDLWIGGNFALVDGKVQAGSDIWRIEKRKRTLQGLSPYSLNASLMYEGDRFGTSASYTRVGRVLIYGGEEEWRDWYENPRNVLDLQVYARFLKRRLEIKINASDILNEDILVYQNRGINGTNSGVVDVDLSASGKDYNEGDYVMSRTGKGVNLTLTATYKF